MRRRDARVATASEPPKPTSPEPTTSAAPTIVRPPQPSEMPRIVRLKEDSTTVLAAPPTEEFSAPTTALRIQRREPTSDTTARVPLRRMMTPQRPHRSPTSQQPTADVDVTKPSTPSPKGLATKHFHPSTTSSRTGRRTLLRWQDDQPHPAGRATRVRPALREPCGRIHWAGTETSAKMYGFIDGAVRSCARAAIEVTEREAVTVA